MELFNGADLSHDGEDPDFNTAFLPLLPCDANRPITGLHSGPDATK